MDTGRPPAIFIDPLKAVADGQSAEKGAGGGDVWPGGLRRRGGGSLNSVNWWRVTAYLWGGEGLRPVGLSQNEVRQTHLVVPGQNFGRYSGKKRDVGNLVQAGGCRMKNVRERGERST